MSVLLVLALLQGFLSGFSVLLPQQKNQHSKFQFDQDRGAPLLKTSLTDVASSLNIIIYLAHENSTLTHATAFLCFTLTNVIFTASQAG